METNHKQYPAISITGGFLRSLENNVAVIRAFGFETQIKIFQHMSSGNGVKTALTILIENVRGSRVDVQQQGGQCENLIRSETSVMFDVIAPGFQTVTISYPHPAKEFDFLFFGDVHGVFSYLQQIIQSANEIDPLFIMSNGDMTHSGRLGDYHALADIIGKSRAPFFTSIGNHDKRVRSGRASYRKMLAPLYYAFEVQNVRFIVLDSSRKRGLPKFQYKWLERELQMAQGKRIFVFLHRPPVCPKYNYLSFSVTANAKRFLALMEKYQVEMVFASHIHVLTEFTQKNVRYLVTGGGGGALWRPSNVHHYLHVFVKKSGVDIQVIQLPTPEAKFSQRLKDVIKFNVDYHISNNRKLKQAVLSGSALLASRSATSKGRLLRRRKKM